MNENVNGMDEQSHKAVRLLHLMRLIRESPRLSRKEVCDRFGITERQFYLDRSVLASAGFVFEWDRRARTHVIINDSFEERGRLTYPEAIALGCAVAVLHRGGEEYLAAQALSGLERLLDTSAEASPESRAVRRMLENFREMGVRADGRGGGTHPKLVEEVARALVERRELIFTYKKPNAPPEEYGVHVYGIFAGGLAGLALYVDAWVPAKGDYRTFRLSRVAEWRLGGIFSPRTDYSYGRRQSDVFQVFGVGRSGQRVVFHVQAEQAAYVREQRWHLSQKMTEYEDGSLDIAFQVSAPEEVLWWAMSWKGFVYAISPPELVEKGREIVLRLMKAYHLV